MQYSAGLSPIQSSVKDNASTKIGQKEFLLPVFRKKGTPDQRALVI
jgi:hypothetical protein